MKKKVVISIVLVIVSIIAIFGVTYSYFTRFNLSLGGTTFEKLNLGFEAPPSCGAV